MGTRRIERRTALVRRPVFWIPLLIVALFIVGIGVAFATLVPRALDARDLLQAAPPLVVEVQEKVLAGDTQGATRAAAELSEITAAARQQTSGRLWLSLEWVPFAGPNLHAVRMAASSVDLLAQKTVVPAASLGLDALKPADGRVDLAEVDAIGATVTGAVEAVSEATAMLGTVDRSLLVPDVAAGVDRIDDAVASARRLLGPAEDVVAALPGMLGADGPRDILFLFQNNGEVMPRGGTIGSLAQMRVENGAISLVAQSSASARDMPMYTQDVVPIAPEVRAVFPFGLGRYVQSLTLTPRFSLTAEIAREMWNRTHGVQVDAVIAIDTVALSYFLDATGPIDLPGGLQLTSSNAVPVLLGDLYQQFEPYEVDAINQAFAATTMSRLLSGTVGVRELISVLTRAADEHRVLVWSDRAAEQALIEGSHLEGEPPTSVTDADGFGVYFADWTPGKMQRFMTQRVGLAQAVCSTGDRRVRLSVTLGNSVDPALVSDLPAYVTGDGRATKIGSMRVEVLSYALPGYRLVGQTADGPAEAVRAGTDGEFGVAQQTVTIGPQQTRTLTFDYLATEPAEVALVADVTPVVNPTQVVSDSLDCALLGNG
ncbi:hypothetical protein DCE93_10360 [Agromyces badenianii]|uniref:DUF4012 domain-containing protein n=1 Tax=Agromyces badenianii TaxID=2080742 RepID=A0A2S0WXH7_9MICO|nr:DUF4012 domain-containing protein [Agromyces badenianii]AWB96012.1 hypothetical protein DCE93_10360 [Agromyces badenianii]